ncbi:MAG: Gfo/Idh/MocA family oxidoreductase [bacterium]|nr:Gfo/Idh/MocA family oxidoreductase [bacterium]
MIRIGAVDIDTSHPGAFACYLSRGTRARYVAIYNEGFRGDDEVDGFIKKFGLERRCESLEELADTVDIGFLHSCNWEKHLPQAMAFIERGKPVFIDKPIVGSPAHCRKLEELAGQGAVILGSSSVRYVREIENFLSLPEEERGKVTSVFGTTGVDEFNYGIHIVEAIGGLLGQGAVSNRFVGRSTIEDKVCETYYVRFESGVSAVYNTFCGAWQPFEMVIITTAGTFQFRIDTNSMYGALLDRICDYLETGVKRMAAVEELTESVRIMLAGRLSRTNNGVEVYLKDISDEDPGYDGYEFERGYAVMSSKIYRGVS